MFSKFVLEQQFNATFRKKEEYKTKFVNQCHQLDASRFFQPLTDSAYLSDKRYKCWLQDEISRLYIKLDALAYEISKFDLEEKSILKEATRAMTMFKSE